MNRLRGKAEAWWKHEVYKKPYLKNGVDLADLITWMEDEFKDRDERNRLLARIKNLK